MTNFIIPKQENVRLNPVDPAFAVGVDVHQHQPLHQVGEDELP